MGANVLGTRWTPAELEELSDEALKDRLISVMPTLDLAILVAEVVRRWEEGKPRCH